MNAPDLTEARIARGPDVVIGPGLLRGPRLAHMVKNQATGRRYLLGPREYFVLSRLDGRRSLNDIGAEYAATFGRRLDDAAWGKLLGLLGVRGLLAGAPRRAAADRVKTSSSGLERLGPVRGRYTLGDPSAFISRLYRRISWIYQAPVLIPLLAALLVMDGYLAAHLSGLAGGLRTLRHQPSLAMLGAIVLWSSAAAHEIAHGITVRHYGGNATAIGIRWWGPVIAAFCAADDMYLFWSRRARVGTAVSGVIANHVFLAPFFGLWLILPAGDVTREAIGGVLLLGIGQALFNYLPLPPLDGYHVLAHLLNLSNFAAESRRYLWMRLAAGAGRRPVPDGYPAWVRPVYLVYGVVAVLTTVALFAFLTLWWYPLVPAAWAPWLFGGVALFVLSRWFLLHRRPKNDGPDQQLKTGAVQ